MKIASNSRGAFATLTLTAAGVLLSAGAAAQQLEEVTVTARKREEKLQDIPASITAITSDRLERESVSDIKDVAKLTPGLVFDLGFVPQDTRPQIRGIPATRGRPPVGILIDNIDVSSESMQTSGGGMIGNVRLMDLERIEVLKGPQSVLYGRAAFAGAINYVTAKPSFTDEFVKFSGDFANYGRGEGKVSLNKSLAENFAVRMSATYAQHDGYYRNSITGNKIGGFESKGVTFAARYEPTDTLAVNFRIAYADDHYDPRAQVAFGVGTGLAQAYAVPSAYVGLCLGRQPASQPTTPQATCAFGARVGTAGFAARPGALGGRTTVTLSVDPLTGEDFPGTDLKSRITSLQLDWDLGFGSLTSWTGYAQADTQSRQDVDSYGAVPSSVTLPSAGNAEPLNFSQVVDLDTTTKQLSQELRLSSPEENRLRWGIGAQFWRETIDQINYAYTISTIVGRSASRAVQMAGASPRADEAKTTKHLGYYGTLEFAFTDTLTGRLEGRYSKEDFDYKWLSPARGIAFAPTALNPTASATNPQWVPATYAVNNSSFNAFTPRATLNWKLSPDVMLYGVVAKGFKSGGFITLAGTPPDFAAFDPETLISYELGAKTEWLDGRLMLNANVFYMKNEDKLFTTLEPDTRSVTGTSLKASNNSDATSKGIELESAFQISDNFSLSLQYTYTNAKYTRFAPLTTGTLGIAQAGNCTLGATPSGTILVAGVPQPAVVRYCITSNAGIPLERAPKHSAAGTFTYKQPVGGDRTLIAETSIQYVGDRPEGANITGIVFGAYTNVDARIGLQNETWSAYIYGENIFDDDTIRSGQAGGDFASAGNQLTAGYLPDRRQIGLRVGYRF